MKSNAEKELEDGSIKKVAVRLKNLHSYHHLEEDKRREAGDVVEVVEGRAIALEQQGLAERVSADEDKPSAKKSPRERGKK
jgi:hypothetical protein